jgi:hypothetical protein
MSATCHATRRTQPGRGRETARSAMLMLFSAAWADPPILKQEPPPGALKAGEVVLVDDGTCLAGQIKR